MRNQVKEKLANKLMEAGIDTGLIAEENGEFVEEYFISENAGIHDIKNGAQKKLQYSGK
ncbi:MAG: hypothetical protein J6C37_02810 [Roseburia sp.]|nr:hypothetical protein [Roseburia sp.]